MKVTLYDRFDDPMDFEIGNLDDIAGIVLEEIPYDILYVRYKNGNEKIFAASTDVESFDDIDDYIDPDYEGPLSFSRIVYSIENNINLLSNYRFKKWFQKSGKETKV